MKELFLRARALVVRLVVLLPDRVAARLMPGGMRYDASRLPAPITAPAEPIRLLIAPANYAAQGHAWARAADRCDGVGAVNMQVRGEPDYGFPADYSIPLLPFRMAYHWSRRHRRAVTSEFTHVLFEAERPFLGRVSNFDVRREVDILRRAGLEVAFVSHGSDLRLPSRHALVDEWSPFADATDPWIQALEAKAAANNALLEASRAPVFVPTPELLLDRPDATWLPIVVDPARWECDQELFVSDRPRVLHVPTHGPIKGTELVEPVVHRLQEEGVIEYIGRTGVPSADMPELYRSVDVVLEQFRLGIYATTAIEAMAAGRLVVGYLRDQVRDHVREVSGHEVPIVQATGETLDEVLRDLAARPSHYRDIAARGPRFVRAVHDGAYSSQVLARFLTPEAAA
ncbi:MAG: hypothetical protein ACTHJM_14395 [Marmoricola sp.]